LNRLFEPLGYAVEAERLVLDDRFPEWGESAYFRVALSNKLPVHVLLSHLYVLIPVLDNDKHYWVGDAEVEKLLRHGEGWLAGHPERPLIATRYLKYRRRLIDDALAQLSEGLELDAPDERHSAEEIALETTVPVPAATAHPSDQAPSLHDLRLGTTLAVLKASAARSVLDLGCGEGRLLRLLLSEKQFTRITGMDVSHRALARAVDRLHYDRLPPKKKERLTLLHGSLMYRDERLTGHEAAAAVEVIEHLDSPRLAAFERVLFVCIRPATVVLTTPNREYNDLFSTLPAGQFRHRDHRFEWTRAEFIAWCETIRTRFGYHFRILSIGPEDPTRGAPSQMAVFSLSERETENDFVHS
jgi:3' terminal RNA ribose 2'-O-methyltransferase Hen1